MFYIVSIKDEKNAEIRGTTVDFNKETKEVVDIFSYNSFKLDYKYGIYDDTDNSVEYVDTAGLIKCFCLNIKIKGITPRYNLRGKQGIISLIISKVGVSHDDIIKFDKVLYMDASKSVFNPNIVKSAGNMSSVDYILAGNDSKLVYRLFYRDSDSTVKFSYIRDKDKYLEMHKGHIVFVGDTLLINEIYRNHNISCGYTPVEVNEILENRKLQTVMDLYVISVIKPELNKFCTIIDDTDFIIDTLTSRYIYKVDSRLSTYVLKNKLLGRPLFGH